MSIANAYTAWAPRYDSHPNVTRDLDHQVTRQLLAAERPVLVVEAGCGTGKNTPFFAQIAQRVQALDFSPGMLELARRHAPAAQVRFQQADLQVPWPCAAHSAQLISFNLVLEHVQDLALVLRHAAQVLAPGGKLFISELHPFKQYQGSQARFVDAAGSEVKVTAFTHHISDFIGAAAHCGLRLHRLNEWWHADDSPQGVPRLLTLLFQSTENTTA